MKVRFYVAPQQGDGTGLNPYRSILNDMIDIKQGEWFDEIDNPAKHISICCVHALDATHTKIVSDPKVVPVGNMFEEKDGTLDKLISDVTSLNTKLSGKVVSSFKETEKVRDILGSIMREFTVEQILQGQRKIVDKESIGKLRMSGEEF